MNTKQLSDKVILIIIIVIAFYVGIVLFSDITSIIEQTYRINYSYLPLIAIFMIAQIGILGIKFHRLLKKLDIILSFKESIHIFISGLSLIITPAGIGTAIKSHILKKKYGKPISSTLSVVLIERLTELFAVLLILTFILIWVNSYESIIAVIFGYVLLFSIIMLVSNNKIFESIKRIVIKIQRIKKLSMVLDESQDSYKKLMNKKTFSEALGWSILGKIFQFLSVYFIFISLDVNFEWFVIGEIYHTPLILGIISFIPSGIIVTESSMIALLIKNNIEISLSTLIVIFVRIVTIWIPMSVGIFALKQLHLNTSDTDDTL